MRKLGRILLGLVGIVAALLWPQEAMAHYQGVVSEQKPSDGVSPASREQGHEVGDARPMLVVYCALGLFFIIFSIMGIAAWLLQELRPKHSQQPVTQYQLNFRHAPYAETSIARDWVKIDQETKQRLETYHWVDRKAGVVAIPVERAMQIIGTEGLPSRPGQRPLFSAPDQEMKALGEMEKPHEITKSF